MGDFYALLHDEVPGPVELFAEEADAEAALREILADEPEWEPAMRIEAIDIVETISNGR